MNKKVSYKYFVAIVLLTLVAITASYCSIQAKKIHSSYSIEEIEKAKRPKGYYFVTTGPDGQEIKRGNHNYTLTEKMFSKNLMAISIPSSGLEDDMIYTTFTAVDMKDDYKTYDVLYINEPVMAKWVAAVITDETGTTTLYTFYDSSFNTIYDRFKTSGGDIE